MDGDQGNLESCKASGTSLAFRKQKIKSPSRDLKDQPLQFSPKLFINRSVFIRIKDRYTYEIVKYAFLSAGAKVYDSSPLSCQIIVSDKPIDYSDKAIFNTRGAILATKNAPPEALPKFVLLANVLWATQKPISKTAGYMIIADAACEKRPVYLKIDPIPVLQIFDTPKGYMLSPFVLKPVDMSATIAKNREFIHYVPKPVDGPEGSGYCDICGENFVAPEVHRKSKKHQLNSKSSWSVFDQEALSTSKGFFTVT